jgi:Bacterial regulatory proteins, tetR family.
MARKAVLIGGKKDELIAAALKLFIANGYENTSVRVFWIL